MAIIVSKKSFQSSPMPIGLNPAVIAEVVEKDIPSYDDKSKLERKVLARFVNAEGQEATRFYTPSFGTKTKESILLKDLKALGIVKGEVPENLDVEKELKGRQVIVLISESDANRAKIGAVAKAPASQKIVAPAKKSAAPAAAPTPAAQAAVEAKLEITDDDIPF